MLAGFSLKQTTAEGFNNGLPNDAGAEIHLSREDAGLYFIHSLNLHFFPGRLSSTTLIALPIEFK